jgi:hypothetical protein
VRVSYIKCFVFLILEHFLIFLLYCKTLVKKEFIAFLEFYNGEGWKTRSFMPSLWGQGEWKTLRRKFLRRMSWLLQKVNSQVIIMRQEFPIFIEPISDSLSPYFQKLRICLQREQQLRCGCHKKEPVSSLPFQKMYSGQHETGR